MHIRQWIRPLFSPIGLVGWAIVLIKPVLWLIGIMGDVEFISTNAVVIQRFLETGFGTLTTVLGGAFFIAYSAYQGHRTGLAERPAGPQAGARENDQPESDDEVKKDDEGSTLQSGFFSLEEPDYGAWDQVRELTLVRAACLWAEQEPVDHPMMLLPEAKPRYTMLREACRDGELGAFVRYNTGEVQTVSNPDFDHFLRRDDLKNFAEARGEKPKFLFPEQR